MTVFELLSIFISLVAVIISGITAYETFFINFKTEVFLRPRVILNRIDGKLAIVLGCEFFNKGAQSGLIDDIVLTVKYKQKNPRVIEKYIFFPVLSRVDYNIYKIYQQIDFEPFQSISIPAKSRLVKYIVFNPSNENFSASVGEANIALFFRNLMKKNGTNLSIKLV